MSCLATTILRLIGGREDAHVDANRIGAPHSLEPPIREHADEFHLGARRDLTDFVKEQGPSVRRLEDAFSSGIRAGERAFRVAAGCGVSVQTNRKRECRIGRGAGVSKDWSRSSM